MPNALHFYGEFAPFASGRRNVARLATRPRRACIVFINLAPGSSYALEILESLKLKIAFQATFWILLQDISILLGHKNLLNAFHCRMLLLSWAGQPAGRVAEMLQMIHAPQHILAPSSWPSSPVTRVGNFLIQ